MHEWNEYPHDNSAYDYEGDTLKDAWNGLHDGDMEPFPPDETLQEAWRQLPTLNDAEGKDLAQRFQNAVADFTDKRQTFQHEQDWQLWANLGLKEKLTARIAALDQQEDL